MVGTVLKGGGAGRKFLFSLELQTLTVSFKERLRLRAPVRIQLDPLRSLWILVQSYGSAEVKGGECIWLVGIGLRQFVHDVRNTMKDLRLGHLDVEGDWLRSAPLKFKFRTDFKGGIVRQIEFFH